MGFVHSLAFAEIFTIQKHLHGQQVKGGGRLQSGAGRHFHPIRTRMVNKETSDRPNGMDGQYLCSPALHSEGIYGGPAVGLD